MEVAKNFLPILTLIFITLKLTGYIDWSWWWVLSPALFAGTVAFILTFYVAYKQAEGSIK